MEPKLIPDITFDYLFEQYKKRIYAYVLSIVKSAFTAEEITQEIFIKLWLHENRLHEIANLEGFIFKIVRNQALNHLRKAAYDERLLKEIISLAVPEHNNIEDKLINADYQLLMQEALNQLSPQRRLVYEMSRKKGMNHEEISIQLNLSKNTVKNHIVSALKQIRLYLNENGISIAVLLFFIM